MSQEKQDPQGRQTLQGWVPDVEDKKTLCKALDNAFEYRGDVTLTLRDGQVVEGYIYDRRPSQDLEHSLVRIMPRDQDEKLEIPYDQIARLQFSGKDTAHGKSWENWLIRWAEKKAAGQSADLYGEKLDDQDTEKSGRSDQ